MRAQKPLPSPQPVHGFCLGDPSPRTKAPPRVSGGPLAAVTSPPGGKVCATRLEMFRLWGELKRQHSPPHFRLEGGWLCFGFWKDRRVAHLASWHFHSRIWPGERLVRRWEVEGIGATSEKENWGREPCQVLLFYSLSQTQGARNEG